MRKFINSLNAEILNSQQSIKCVITHQMHCQAKSSHINRVSKTSQLPLMFVNLKSSTEDFQADYREVYIGVCF